MHSLFWAAVLVLLLLTSGPASAGERPTGRVSRSRILSVSTLAEGVPAELHVAGGTATVISVAGSLAPEGPRLVDAPGSVRLLVMEAASFIVLPTADVAKGKSLRLSVPLQSGDSLQLSLVTTEGEVDTQVRLVPLLSPTGGEASVGDVAHILNESEEEPVELSLPQKRLFTLGRARASIESGLRVDQHVFMTLVLWGLPGSPQWWRQIRVGAVLEDGSRVTLPVQRLQFAARIPEAPVQYQTFMVVLPEAAASLVLGVKGKGALEETVRVSLGRGKPTR